MKGGRPTKFRPEYTGIAQKMAELGATDKEIADALKICERTLYRWIAENPEFCQALKIGKEPADDRVVRSLFHRANGYTFDSVKIMQHQGEEVIIPYREHVPPDVTACIFWLKNRRRDEWRDKTEQEHTGGLTIEVVKISDSDTDSPAE